MKTSLPSSLRRVLAAVGIALASTWSAYAGFPAGTPTTPYLTGQNYWYSPPDSAYGLLKDSGVTLVRIGGHAYDVTPLSDAELLHQVDNIRSIGAEPIIQISRFASVQTAANTLTFLNVTNGRHVKFWSIGNEPDLGWTGTDADLTAYVAGYIKQYAPALRDVDPSITILAPDFSYYNTTRYAALLGGASDITGTDAQGRYYVDGITFHRYPFGATYARSDVLTELHSTFEGRVNALQTLIASANTLHGRTGTAALRWGLTEFNIDYANPTNNTPAGLGAASFLNGQFFAEYYRVGVKHGVSVMNTWSMLEGGGNGSSGDLGYLGGTWTAPVKRSTYYHLQMVADTMLPGGYVATTYPAGNLVAWSTSSVDQSTLAVMVLNEDTTGSQTFTLRLNNDPVAGPGAKINVAAGLPQEYSATLGNQTTAVLLFDATGALRQRVTYSVANCLANQPPQVELFSPATAAPTTPGPILATVGDAQVTLSWPAIAGATGYNVKRAPGSGGPYSTIAAGVIGTTFTDAGLTNGSTYCYVVSAVNDAGESADSAEAGVTPQAAPATLALEAEGLAVTSSGSTVSVNSDAAASGGKWVQLNATAVGPWMQFTTGTIPAGTYTLQLTYKANPNRGQLGFAVDGGTIGATLDEYAGATAFLTKTVGTVTFAASGSHTLRLTTTGKNSASTGYLLAADKFSFVGPTAAGVALSGLEQTYDGTPKPVSATTSPTGLAVALTYNGATTAPTAAGVYPVMATITDPAYYGAVSSRLVIDRARATVNVSGLVQSYDGTPKPVTVATAPAGLSTSVTYNGSPNPPTQVGSYPVFATITDPNYTGSASGSLTIADTTPPVLSLPANLTAEATSPNGATVVLNATASDDVDGTIAVTLSPASGSTFPLGTTTVTATAHDAAGNVATGSFTVTVRDTTPPALTTPSNLVLEATSAAGAAANFAATATDAVTASPVIAYSQAPGSTFPLGVTTVTVIATDAAGNKSTGSFTVTVHDTTPPALTVPANQVIEATSAAGATATFSASATDAVTASPAIAYSQASGSTFPLGTTTVNVTATDAAGNQSTGSFTVTVRDTTPPTISSVSASPNTIWPPNKKMVPVTISVVAADAVGVSAEKIVSVATNEPDGNTQWQITGPLTLNVLADRLGTGTGRIYTITIQVRDAAGNASTKTVTVTVPHDQGA